MNLLLIMPNFFDYPKQIKLELEKIGYNVDFFDDRPSTNSLVKAIIKINKNYINGYINKYFHWIMNTISDTKYDVVLLISGQSLSFSETMIKELRASQTSARFILYQWDSQKNFPYIVKMHKFFDVRYSFDKVDTESAAFLSRRLVHRTIDGNERRLQDCHRGRQHHDSCRQPDIR